MSAAPLARGDVVAGKYLVDRVLATGGRSLVVSALHQQLEERVAIKLLLEDALQSPETVERFVREARATVKIKSQHVARVVDVGKLDSGAPYMVMEYLEGQDLADRVAAHGPLSVGETVELVMQACEALAEAHVLGIVHRDLKPANLFLTRSAGGLPIIKVLDFGISKVSGPLGPRMSMTRTTNVMGSPYYMSPEQLACTRDTDPRSDIWAIGVVLYELLSGRVPFDGNNVAELCVKIMQEPPRPLRSLRPDVPEGIERIIACCLQKDRARRYPNVAGLAQALSAFGGPRVRPSLDHIFRVLQTANAEPHRGKRPRSDEVSSPDAGVSTQRSWVASLSAAPSQKTTRTLLAVGAAGLLIALAGGYKLLSGARADAARATVTQAAQPPAATLPRRAPPAVETPAPTASTKPVETASAAPPPSPPSSAKAGKGTPSGGKTAPGRRAGNGSLSGESVGRAEPGRADRADLGY